MRYYVFTHYEPRLPRNGVSGPDCFHAFWTQAASGNRAPVGKVCGEFKKASNQFQGQIHDEIRKLELEEVNPVKHIQPEIAKLKDDEDLSLTGALNRLTERIKNSVPQDYDA